MTVKQISLVSKMDKSRDFPQSHWNGWELVMGMFYIL